MRIASLLGRRSTSTLLAAVLASSLGGCGKKEEAPAPTPLAQVATDSKPVDDEAGRPRREPEKPAPRVAQEVDTLKSSALKRLPADVALVGALRPQALLEALGHERLLEKYGVLLEEVSAPVVEGAGAHPLRAEGWEKLGLDMAAPAGFWVADLRANASGVFLGVSDRTRVEAAVAQFAKEAELPLEASPVGEGTLWTVNERLAVLLTDDALYLVNGPSAAALARGLAERPAAQGLLASESYAALAGAVGSPAGGLYARFDQVASARLIDEDESASMRAALEGLGDMVLGLELKPHGFAVNGKIALKPNGDVLEVLPLHEGTLPVLKMVADEPLLAFGLKLTPEYARRYAVWAVNEAGFEPLLAAVKERDGVDLERELFAQLDGNVGVVLTGEPSDIKSVGGGLILGLSDATKVQALLAQAGKAELFGELASWDEASKVLTIPREGGGPLLARVEAAGLVVSTDPEMGERLAGEGTFAAGSSGELKGRLEAPGLSGLFFAKPVILGWLERRAERPPMGAPTSAEARRVQEEIERLEAEIEPLRRAAEAKRLEPLLTALTKAGTWSQTVRAHKTHLEIRAGLDLAGATLAEFAEAMVEAALHEGVDAQDADFQRLRALENQRWELESELMRKTQHRFDD